jgi:hypothetical protein
MTGRYTLMNILSRNECYACCDECKEYGLDEFHSGFERGGVDVKFGCKVL